MAKRMLILPRLVNSSGRPKLPKIPQSGTAPDRILFRKMIFRSCEKNAGCSATFRIGDVRNLYRSLGLPVTCSNPKSSFWRAPSKVTFVRAGASCGHPNGVWSEIAEQADSASFWPSWKAAPQQTPMLANRRCCTRAQPRILTHNVELRRTAAKPGAWRTTCNPSLEFTNTPAC